MILDKLFISIQNQGEKSDGKLAETPKDYLLQKSRDSTSNEKEIMTSRVTTTEKSNKLSKFESTKIDVDMLKEIRTSSQTTKEVTFSTLAQPDEDAENLFNISTQSQIEALKEIPRNSSTLKGGKHGSTRRGLT